jgi:hypothetical protein
MKAKLFVILSLLILAGSGFAFSEDQALDTNTVSAPSDVTATPQESVDSPNTQWVWGEVASVDAQNRALKLKYLDYETDQEKEMVLNTDEQTSYDNIKSLEDIQPKDNISVDYVVKDSKNIARSIGLEKAENAAPAIASQAVGMNSVETPKIDAQVPQSNQ